MSDPKPAIFITGAAAGIGRATAQLFLEKGWFVGMYDINPEIVMDAALVRTMGNGIAGQLDVTDYPAMQTALAEFTAASAGRLDLMFNNAGIASVEVFEDVPITRQHALIDVNFKGVVNGCNAALPHLKRTPGSRLISMASASAIYGAPSFAVYSATKFAVRGLSEALDIEWSRHGIRVMDVMPLFVNTPMVAQFDRKPKSFDRLGMHLTSEDIARTVWRAAHWKLWTRVHWYPGLQTKLLALFTKLQPAWLNRTTTKLVSGF
ncbi:MAG TPA: SDR family oxidoreductase [Solimonas sp.]|nr:SDR family oxidoreductase [Solimonas sp.]